MRGQTHGAAECEDAVTDNVERGEGLVLTMRDRLLLGLWLLPVALGLVVGVRAGDDDGSVMLFVTGIVAALYVVVLISLVRSARRRRAGPTAAGATAGEPAEPGAGPEHQGDPGERGRAPAVARALQLVLVVFAAVYVVAEGGWTFVVVAVQLVTVITMAAHVHERDAEPDPVV